MIFHDHHIDSGIPWLGAIPSRWDVSKFKYHFIVGMGETILNEDLIDNGLIPVYSATEGDHFFGYVNKTKLLLKAGDIVVPARGNSIGHIKLVSVNATTTQTTIYCKSRARRKLVSEYAYYFMIGLKARLFSFTKTAIPQITVAEVLNNPILIPPFEEQQCIARYLDRETAKINLLISKQEWLIGLLEEKRKSVITEAVTNGLDPNVELKPSGVASLGLVPMHWKVSAIKRFLKCKITDGPHETPEFLDEGVPFVSAEAISGGFINFDKIRGFISEQDHLRYSKKYAPKIGDVYMIKSGATTGTAAIVEDGRDFNIWSPLAAMRCGDQLNPYFLLNFIRSSSFQSAVSLGWNFGTQQNIGMGVIENLSIAVPPLEEQYEICKALSNKCSKIELLIEKCRQAIVSLRQRRTCLIQEVVTGKIDVRGLA